MKRTVFFALLLYSITQASCGAEALVRAIRVPHEGIQPQVAVGHDGAVHLIYFKGEAGAGDIYYVHSDDLCRSFSLPLRVNSQPGSAIAAGTIRGAHLAIGKSDRVHVAWNGSGTALPKGLPNPALPEDSPYRFSMPMLYARISDDGSVFEPQRNLMTSTFSLDGGGSVAADRKGNVYVVWHASSNDGAEGEEGRAVWVATSRDDGQTFTAEVRANQVPTGACGCCGLRASTDRSGYLYVLYRSALNTIHRDMYLLVSKDHGRSFATSKLDDWQVGQCVMSSASLFDSAAGMLAAWETEQQVRFAAIDPATPSVLHEVVSPFSSEQTRKHPVLCASSQGQVLLAWTEGTGWQKGGAAAWQVFDRSGQPVPGGAGRVDGVPVWGLVAAFAGPNGGFTVLY